MIPAHLINGMCPTDDKPKTKREAHNKAKDYRTRGVHACVFHDDDEKQYYIYVPVGVTLSLF